MTKGTDINWDDLRYLRLALQAGSLAGAARALRVEHTTIGRRLSSLEKSLGAAVVARGPTGLRPTAIGAELVPLLDDIDRAVASLQSLVEQRRSHVRFATPSGFASYFTSSLATLRAAHPRVSLEIMSGARPVDLQKGEADLALRVGPIADPSLIARKIGDVGWALYASSSYLKRTKRAVDVDDLTGHEIIGFDRGLAESPAAKWLEARARGATVVHRSREMVDTRDAVVSGIGLAVLPCALGDESPLLRRVHPDVVATRAISIVYRRDARVSAALRVVIRFVVDVITARANELSGSAGMDPPRSTGANRTWEVPPSHGSLFPRE
jgi:DNA-binding transcriptional LysR family regulator